MSIDVTPRGLYREFDAARSHWNKVQAIRAKMIARYVTPAYSGSEGQQNSENFHYAFVLHMTARLTSGVMVPHFTSEKRDQDERVKGLEEYCKQWIQDTGFERENERCIVDMCFGDAVALVKQKARRGYEQHDDPPMTPTGERFPIGLWGCDPYATKYPDNARYAYHICIDLKSDLLAMAEADDTWDMGIIRRLSDRPAFRSSSDFTSERKEVAYVCMWVPGYELPADDPAWESVDRDKCNGTIFTLTSQSEDGIPQFIRRPMPYFGPRIGPYVYEGFLLVPDQVRTLSPLQANNGQIEELNAQVRANNKLGRNAKTVTVLDSAEPAHEMRLQNAEHGDFLAIAGVREDQVHSIEIGNISNEARAREMELRAQTARGLNLPDLAYGEVTGAGTATENNLAAQQLAATTEFFDRGGQRIARGVLIRVAWFADQDERTVSQRDGNLIVGGQTRDAGYRAVDRAQRVGMVGPEDATQMRSDVEQSPDVEHRMFEDLEITIERVKRDPVSLAKFQQATEFIIAVAPIVPAMASYAPGLQAFFDRAGDEFGISEVSGVFDMDAAVEFQKQQEHVQEQAAPRSMPAPTPATPRPNASVGSRSEAKAKKPENKAVKLRSA